MIRHATAFSLCLALVAAGPAFAQNPQEEAALRQNCTGDYLRYCGNFAPNTPEVEQCFKTNMKQLSAACQQTIAAYSKKNGPTRTR